MEGEAATQVIGGGGPSGSVRSSSVKLTLSHPGRKLSLCTGTYVGQNRDGDGVVVTAAHCLVDRIEGIELVSGSAKASARSYLAHPGYRGSPQSNDVGFVLVKGDALRSIPPARIIHSGDGLRVRRGDGVTGEAIAAGGFGARESGRQGDRSNSGTLGQYTATIDSMGPGGLVFYSGRGGFSSGLPCRGDSGGPAYVTRNNVQVLAGIIAGGDFCRTPLSAYTNLVVYGNWLALNARLGASQFAAAGGRVATAVGSGERVGTNPRPSTRPRPSTPAPLPGDRTARPGVTYRSAVIGQASNVVYVDASRRLAHCFNLTAGTRVSVLGRDGTDGKIFRVGLPSGACRDRGGAIRTTGYLDAFVLTDLRR